MTLAEFRIAYPEFKTATDDLVETRLAYAASRLSTTVLGTVYPEAHGSLAAHLIATTAGGQMSRMVNKDGTTQYSRRLDEIKMACVAGVLVA
jgi:hypothetical protein